MKHITNTPGFERLTQVIKKWEATKIDLKSLTKCKECGTTTKNEVYCANCSEINDKLNTLHLLNV